MKNAILVAIFTIILTLVSLAQDYKLSDITMSSGRGALSSGIFASTNVVGDNNTRLIMDFEKSFVEIMYGVQSEKTFLAGSAGLFENAPWIGHYIVFQPSIFTITSWSGIAAGQANDPKWKLQFLFLYHSIRMDVEPFYIAWTRISFQKDAVNDLPGAGVVIPVGSKITCSVGGEYTLRDKKPLFGAALNYKL
jgi:hypothetical protein